MLNSLRVYCIILKDTITRVSDVLRSKKSITNVYGHFFSTPRHNADEKKMSIYLVRN